MLLDSLPVHLDSLSGDTVFEGANAADLFPGRPRYQNPNGDHTPAFVSITDRFSMSVVKLRAWNKMEL